MKVFYQRTYSIAPYLTERIGFEVESDLDPIVDSHDSITNQVATLKELCDKAHKELNPNLEEMKGTHVLKVPQEPPNMSDPELDAMQKDQALIDTINYCTNTRSVEMFRKEVERRNNPLITEAFENKLQSLKNQ